MNWFVIYTMGNLEAGVEKSLKIRGYETFLPTVMRRQRHLDETKACCRALFTGYFFARFRIEDKHAVLAVPGVVHIVGKGHFIEPLEDGTVEQIRQVMKIPVEYSTCDFQDKGEPIVIRKGPLAGMQGIVAQEGKNFILFINVKLLGRAVRVCLHRQKVRALLG
jgi:transcription antitermination factor NusG